MSTVALPTPCHHGTSATAVPATLPEAAFSLCLKGRFGGQDTQLTIRGQSYGEFATNVVAVRGFPTPSMMGRGARDRKKAKAAAARAPPPQGAGRGARHRRRVR